MATGQRSSTINVGGLQIVAQDTRTASGVIIHDPSLPAGISGTLSTRTDDDTGVATLGAGHGITTSDVVDVFWSGGVRYGMSVTLVNATEVSIDLGAGDVLPAQDTALIVGVRQEIDSDFDGDLLELLALACDRRAHVELLTEADASLLAVELPAGGVWDWLSERGVTNPLAGQTVGKFQASCGETQAGALQVGVLYGSA